MFLSFNSCTRARCISNTNSWPCLLTPVMGCICLQGRLCVYYWLWTEVGIFSEAGVLSLKFCTSGHMYNKFFGCEKASKGLY